MNVKRSNCQAIVTKYLGPTDKRVARVKATAQAGSITITWDDGLGIDGNHDMVALALCEKLEWNVDLISGGLPMPVEGYQAYVITKHHKEK